MTEAYAEVASKYSWTDPRGRWRIFLVCYVVAITLYLAVLVGQITIWAVERGLVSIPLQPAIIFDQAMTAINALVFPVFVICALATVLLLYRLISNAHVTRSPEQELTGPGMAVAAFFIPFVSLIMPPSLWDSSGVRP